jgi:DNA polymerase (family X)
MKTLDRIADSAGELLMVTISKTASLKPPTIVNKKMTNPEVCAVLRQIGELLELTGENPFKARAYFNAVQVIQTLDVSLTELVKQGQLKAVRSIGKALTQKITELVETGKLAYYDRLRASVPIGLFEIAALPGMDRRKTGLLFVKLGVLSLAELAQACRDNKVCTVRGFKAADQERLLTAIMELTGQHDFPPRLLGEGSGGEVS